MSLKVLVVPEDPTHNGDILKPLIQRMLLECGRPNAKVDVLTSPKVQGYEHAKGSLPAILDRYHHFDLILFLVDADGKDKSNEFEHLENEARHTGSRLICCAAQQEVEAWLLAGHPEKLDRPWGTIRADVSVKENVFQPFLAKHGDARRYGSGRDILMAAGLVNYAGILARCPELKVLQDRIAAQLSNTA